MVARRVTLHDLAPYLFIVVAFVVGLKITDSRLQSQRNHDQDKLCQLSHERWVVAHNEILRNTEHVAVPDEQLNDPKLVARVRTRNDQLDAHRLAGLTELGSEPRRC